MVLTNSLDFYVAELTASFSIAPKLRKLPPSSNLKKARPN